MIKEKLLRSSSHLYILNLSLGDLIVIIGTVPFVGSIYTLESWPYGEFVCKFSEFIRDVSIGVSVMTLSAMSIDRYRAAFATTMIRVTGRTGGSRPYSIVSSLRTQTGAVMAGIWLIAVTLATPTAYFSYILKFPHPDHPGVEEKEIHICYPFPDELGPYYPKIVVLAKCVVFYIIPLLIIGCCYVSIAVHLISKSKSSSAAMPSVSSGMTQAAAVASSSSSRAVGTSVSTANPSSSILVMTSSQSHSSQNYSSRVRSSPIHPIPPPPSNSPSIQRFNVNHSFSRFGTKTPRGSDLFLDKSHTTAEGNDLLMTSDVNMTALVKSPHVTLAVTPATSPDVTSSSLATGINATSMVVLTSKSERGSHDNLTGQLDIVVAGDEGNTSRASPRAQLTTEKYSPTASAGFKRSRKKSQSRAKMILLLVIIFLVCFFPHHLFMMWFYYHPNSQNLYNQFWHVWRIVAFCLTFLNSTLNPITLYLTSDQFKSLFNKYIWTKACENSENLSPSDSSFGGSSENDHHHHHNDHYRGNGRKSRSSSRGKTCDQIRNEGIAMRKKNIRNKSSSSETARPLRNNDALSSSSTGKDNSMDDNSCSLNPSPHHNQHRQEPNMINGRCGIHGKITNECVDSQGIKSDRSQDHSSEEDCIKLTTRMEVQDEEHENDREFREGSKRTHQRKSTPHKSYFKHRSNHNHNNNIVQKSIRNNPSDNNSSLNHKNVQNSRQRSSFRCRFDQALSGITGSSRRSSCPANNNRHEDREAILYQTPDTLDSMLENVPTPISDTHGHDMNTSETEDLRLTLASRRSMRLSMTSLEPLSMTSPDKEQQPNLFPSPPDALMAVYNTHFSNCIASEGHQIRVQQPTQVHHVPNGEYIKGYSRRKSSPVKPVVNGNYSSKSNYWNPRHSNGHSNGKRLSSFSFSSSTGNTDDSFRDISLINSDSVTTTDTSL
jgi:hypothetical protein